MKVHQVTFRFSIQGMLDPDIIMRLREAFVKLATSVLSIFLIDATFCLGPFFEEKEDRRGIT